MLEPSGMLKLHEKSRTEDRDIIPPDKKVA